MHAVFTLEDCLAVGGHLYTVAHLPTTLRVLRMQKEFPNTCNEDPPDDIYENLANLLRNFEYIGTTQERISAMQGVCAWTAEVSRASRVTGQKGLREFLMALKEFWKRCGNLFE